MWVVNYGRWAFDSLFKKGPSSLKDFDKYTNQFFQRIYNKYQVRGNEAKSSIKNDSNSEFNIIYNMDGFGVRQLSHKSSETGYVNYKL